MILTIIESPYAGTPEEIKRNVEYAKACVRDSLDRGEAPYASHLFFTQDGLLDDNIPSQRTKGIEAGLAWGDKADLTVVYNDFGITDGMSYGIERAKQAGRPVEFRKLNLHIEIIRCPECDTIQKGTVEHTNPFNTYIHHCEKCEYIIMESEWERVK